MGVNSLDRDCLGKTLGADDSGAEHVGHAAAGYFVYQDIVTEGS